MEAVLLLIEGLADLKSVLEKRASHIEDLKSEPEEMTREISCNKSYDRLGPHGWESERGA